MRFRPANAASSTVMQSSTAFASMDEENMTPNKMNERKMERGTDKSPFASPSAPRTKKHKHEINIEYPTTIDVPSKALLRAFYQSAILQKDSHQNQLDDCGSGLLSFEEVILPAIAHQEVDALKKLQAKAQRDAPHHVEALKQCRRAIYESIDCGIAAAREARLKREATQKANQARMDNEQKAEREATQKLLEMEKAKADEDALARQKQEIKKNHPGNVALWREVAFLMTELAKIKKEERLWKAANKKLDEKEEQLVELKAQEEENQVTEIGDIKPVSKVHEEYQERVDNAIEEINFSSLRIQRAVEVVGDTIETANSTRSQLFRKYTSDHQFTGYAGVNDPKGLIRALSQDP